MLTPAAIERKLGVSAPSRACGRDADADELARESSRLVILGDPGSGKTWLAKRTARISAEQALQALAEDRALDEVELPLYSTCSDLIKASGDIRKAASSAVERIGDLGGSRVIEALRLFFTHRDSQTLLVIDSLDEATETGEARARLREAGSLPSPWRVMLLEPRHAKVFTDVVALTRDAGSRRPDRGPQIEAVTGRYLAELRTEPETIEARLGRFLTYYDNNLIRHENAAEVAQPGVFAAIACPGCRQYADATLGRCPACGQDVAPCLTSSPVSEAVGAGARHER